jgi:hypothetical protein
MQIYQTVIKYTDLSTHVETITRRLNLFESLILPSAWVKYYLSH